MAEVEVHDYQLARQVGIVHREVEREVSAEAVANDHRVIQVVLADIARDAFAGMVEERRWNARHAGESGEGEHVHLVLIFVMVYGAIPYLARTVVSRNQNHGTAMAGDLDLKSGLGHQRHRSG